MAKRYNPREACRRSSEIRTVTDETLGEVRFGVLSISEFTDLKLNEIKDEYSLAITLVLRRMWLLKTCGLQRALRILSERAQRLR